MFDIQMDSSEMAISLQRTIKRTISRVRQSWHRRLRGHPTVWRRSTAKSVVKIGKIGEASFGCDGRNFTVMPLRVAQQRGRPLQTSLQHVMRKAFGPNSVLGFALAGGGTNWTLAQSLCWLHRQRCGSPAELGIGFGRRQAFITPFWSFDAKFDGEFSGSAQTYAGTGTLRYAW